MLHSPILKLGNDKVAPGVKVVRHSMPKPVPMRKAVFLQLSHGDWGDAAVEKGCSLGVWASY